MATMDATRFSVPKMDCSAEESLVRMKLADVPAVTSIRVDLAERTVTIYHNGALAEIDSKLEELGLGARRLETKPVTGAVPADSEAEDQQRRILWAVLAINLGFFILESIMGFLAGSMGLVADSLDMLADALVYGMSLAVVGTTVARKKRVALLSGYFQMGLAALGLAEVVRRFLSVGEAPDFRVMILVAVLALIGNVVCLYLLTRARHREAHMQASMIFTSNDVVINLGVIAAGVMVLQSGSRIPDLVAGAIVFGIVVVGAVRILRLGR